MRNILTLLLLSIFALSCTVKEYYIVKLPTVQKKKVKKNIKLDPAYNSAVMLFANKRTASGSIIKIIDKNTSYVITVKHFCKGIKGKIQVAAMPHRSSTMVKFRGKVEKMHKFLDLCLIRLKGDTKHVRPMRTRSKELYSGMKVYTLGAPAGLWPTKNAGYLIGFSSSGATPPGFKGPDIIAISIPSFYGSSGSPIYDSQGRLIGIIMAVNSRFHHNSIGIPLYLISKFVSHALQK